MALEAYALDTLENVLTRVDVSEDDEQRVAIIEGLINQISLDIIRETGRDFAPTTGDIVDEEEDEGETRIVEYRGGYVIDLAPYEIRTVHAITFNPGDDQVELDAGDYRLEPVLAEHGVYQYIRLKSSRGTGGWPTCPVAITGAWGWPSVPADVRGWLHELVEDRLKEDVVAYADAEGAIQTFAPTTIPFRIRDAMRDYERIHIGAV